ncbi:MAG: response regulator [Clostridia bacterium]|nr:response regulator [Clostridia bacterium]
MWTAVVIDDEPLARELLTSYVEWAEVGIRVIDTCEDGLRALSRIRELCPDIVLTDISMPGLSGIELLEKLREEELTCEVIIISVSSDFVHAQRAVQLGAFDYLLKPIGAETLRACLGQCVRKLDKARHDARMQTLPVVEHYSAYTQRALRHIHANYRDPIQLGSVAEAVGVSRSHLSKVFKEDTGSAFNEYLIAYRMNAAHALIRKGRYKVYEVAAMVGYSDVVHFSKMFKKTFGIAPKKSSILT